MGNLGFVEVVQEAIVDDVGDGDMEEFGFDDRFLLCRFGFSFCFGSGSCLDCSVFAGFGVTIGMFFQQGGLLFVVSLVVILFKVSNVCIYNII